MDTASSLSLVAMVITVFLLKTHINSFDAAVDRSLHTRVFHGSATLGFDCRLFLQTPRPHPPTWADFVNSGLASPLPNLTLAGASALLVLHVSGRYFAVTFGRGRYLLVPGSYEEDFGLKVTLNRVDADDLSSIDTRLYDEIVTSSRIQVSRESSIEEFGADLSRDILRAVQGKARDSSFASRLAGADALTISRSALQFSELGTLCSDLLVAYGETAYRTRFGWVDNIRVVRDGTTITSLESALISALKSRNLGSMHLALSEIENTIDIAAYRFTGSGRTIEYSSLELGAYLKDAVGARLQRLTIAKLKQHRVRVRLVGSADFENRATIFDSLVWETTISGKTYALFDGRWFEVDGNYSQDVQQYCSSLLRTAYPLPTAGLDESEGDYNKRAAMADTRLALFDCSPLRPTGARTTIEFCDLMTDSGHLIHVKRRYSSATFSHLFAQGSVSAETLIRDQGFRQEAAQHLNGLGRTNHLVLLPTTRPVASNYEVVYGVIAPGSAARHLLPFFSAVNLRNHGRRLETIGVKVSLQHIVAI